MHGTTPSRGTLFHHRLEDIQATGARTSSQPVGNNLLRTDSRVRRDMCERIIESKKVTERRRAALFGILERRGSGSIYKRGRMWWITYYDQGKEHRESAETTDKQRRAPS